MSNKECMYCAADMKEFVSSDNKVIYMCPFCGSLYIPSETRNKNVKNYIYEFCGSFRTECYNLPSYKQMSYLKYLTKELNYQKDIRQITKYEATKLISELKEELDKKHIGQENNVCSSEHKNNNECVHTWIEDKDVGKLTMYKCAKCGIRQLRKK